jgi:phage terminase small subunit
MKKLSRKEIQEGLQQVPIERVLLGATGANGIKLTKKQKAFAHAVVETGNKTEAYRRAYDTEGKPRTAARDAQKVASNPAVSTYIQALEAAQEVREYLLPARLREMAVQKLSSMALNDDLKPSEQLKALELVGKMSEVALFSERREIVHSLNSADLKAQLMDAVQAAIHNSKTLHSKTKRSAAELLAEITQVNGSQDVEYQAADTIDQEPGSDQAAAEPGSAIPGEHQESQDIRPPTEGQGPFFGDPTASHLHTIPHNRSSAGEGPINPITVLVGTDIEMTPLPNSEKT